MCLGTMYDAADGSKLRKAPLEKLDGTQETKGKNFVREYEHVWHAL